MLMGEFSHAIDAKGRLIIPAKFREQLGGRVVITRGMDGCLFGYPMDQWKQLEAQMNKLSLTKKNARAFMRFMYSAATECEFDKQGRVNIPQTLRTHAGLTKKCVIVGVSDRFEIWDQDRWAKYTEETEGNVDDIAEDLDFDL